MMPTEASRTGFPGQRSSQKGRDEKESEGMELFPLNCSSPKMTHRRISHMLVLTRKTDEVVDIYPFQGDPGNKVSVMVVDSWDGGCRLGFESTEGHSIHRREISDAIIASGRDPSVNEKKQ